MPIVPSIFIRDLTQDEFDQQDEIVMRCAYASQNAIGRLCDEHAHEHDVARRLHWEGIAGTHTQVQVTVSHEDFIKDYFLDLVAGHAVYELKTVAALAPRHDGLALHYAMLLD